MRFRREGLIRLWIILSIVGVPLLAEADFNQREEFWTNISALPIKQCLENESRPPYEDALICAHRMKADQSVFDHEHTTPAAYWSEALMWAFVLDIVITAVVYGVFRVCFWIASGFRPKS